VRYSLFSLQCISIVLLLLLATPAYAVTRNKSIVDFVDSTRVSDLGFADTPDGILNLESTYNALVVHSILGKPVNNTLDLLYYIQTLQNRSGGFSNMENNSQSFDATVLAVGALQYLNLNRSQYTKWQIFPFLNDTANQLLFTDKNGSLELARLDLSHLETWNKFILTSAYLNNIPDLPVIDLVDQVKSLQYANGSYYSFGYAIQSVILLSTLGELPNDPDLAAKYILSYIQSNGAFSSTIDGSPSLLANYQALKALRHLIDVSSLKEVADITRYIFSLQVARSGFRESKGSDPTLTATMLALSVLSYLQQLDELQAPDVLQEVGFISYPTSFMLMSIGIIAMIWRRRR